MNLKTKQWLSKLQGAKYSGCGELWLDPEGNNAELYSCELNIEADTLLYCWVYENQTQSGSFTFNDRGAIWVDSWHQNEPVQCVDGPETWSVFSVSCTYEVSGGPNWGWLSKLSQRPDGSIVLQMNNITPWGEDGRAVRMVFSRKEMDVK